jgi:hypothetical protein
MHWDAPGLNPQPILLFLTFLLPVPRFLLSTFYE